LEDTPVQPDTQTHSHSKTTRWAGWVLSGLAVLFLAWDGIIKLISLPVVADAFARLGYPVSLAVGIGILELVCLAVYVVPRTSLLGAVLLTGYLGGAVATHVRVQDPLLTHVFFPIYVGALIWGGLLLRDARVRALTKQAFGRQPAT
jgi:DoxX-like family